MCPGEIDRVASVADGMDVVAVPGQHSLDEIPDRVLVFDVKDGFVADRVTMCRACPRARALVLIGARQIDLERRAVTDFAVHPDVAAALLDDAVHGGEAEAGAFALWFG